MSLNGKGPLGLKGDKPTRKPAEKHQARKNARGKACTLRLPGCTNSGVVLAHLRFFSQAGMGSKPPDYIAVFGCAHCHDLLDRRDMSAPVGYDDILRALMETLRTQFDDGVFMEVGK